MVNAHELEAQKQQFELEAQTAARGAQQNIVNNPPRVVDEHPGVEEIVPPHRQPLAPRSRVHHPAHIMFEEDDLDLDGVGATGAIVLHVLPPDQPSRTFRARTSRAILQNTPSKSEEEGSSSSSGKESGSKLHQFERMNDGSGEFSNHLTREFYASHAATSMNFAAKTETTKLG
uniref:Uncharacterized protein n=1 Tax=Solanum tuberosum TaxID=4113 RepID=M1DHL4_SOLTU